VSGDLMEQAHAARARGEHQLAKELFEKLWEFRLAAACAQAAGDRAEQLRLLLEAQALTEAAELAAELGPDPGELARAAQAYEHKRLWAQAAGLRERMNEFGAAAELYARAQAPLERGRVLERAGQLREAGIEYERVLRTATEPGLVAQAHLRLGPLLRLFGRLDDSIRHLQHAARWPGTRPLALRPLVGLLAEAGLRDAARRALELLREGAPDAPASLDAFLAPDPAAAAAPAAGEQLIAGRYKLVRMLAAGGYGRVYEALDRLTGTKVALKLFAAPEGARGREAYQRFLREARIVRELRHPSLIAVRDVDEGLGLLVLELAPGGTLADRLAGGKRLAPAPARRVALEVLDALEVAHARGVVHRDLKPANILFDAAGAARLTDFGVAHLADAGQTQTGGLIGTLAYMSPEQVTGAPITFAADLYALGVTLFQAVTGVLPFLGPELAAQHLFDPVPTTGLGAAWDAVLATLMAKAPGDRYASVAAARTALAGLPTDAAAPARERAPTPVPPVRAPEASSERYQRGELTATRASSRVFDAIDTALGRPVVVEAWDESLDLGRLRAVAGAGGAAFERVLRLDEAARVVVYERLLGAAAPVPLGDAAAARAAGTLLAALHPLHAVGRVHGALAEGDAIVWVGAAPVVRASGFGHAGMSGDARVDIAAALLRVAERAEPGAAARLRALAETPEVAPAELVAWAAAAAQASLDRDALALLVIHTRGRPHDAARAFLRAAARARALGEADADRALDG
jgi:serine/threonine-protein kinase